REAHQTRRALDQTISDPLLQTLQLHADRGLGGAQRLRGAGKALELGDGHESLHGFDIEDGHVRHPNLLSLKYPITQFQRDQGITNFLAEAKRIAHLFDPAPCDHALRPHWRKGLPWLLPSRAAAPRRSPRSASPA